MVEYKHNGICSFITFFPFAFISWVDQSIRHAPQATLSPLSHLKIGLLKYSLQNLQMVQVRVETKIKAARVLVLQKNWKRQKLHMYNFLLLEWHYML